MSDTAATSGRPMDLVLERVPGLRPYGGGWRGPCPSHGGASRTVLAVREASDGTVLVRCHRGCTLSEILKATGLTVRALFPRGFTPPDPSRSRRQPTRDEITGALTREADRVRSELIERHAMLLGDELLTSELNQIRARVSKMLGVELQPLVVPLWETGPHARDPLWPDLFMLHWRSVWRSLVGVEPPPMDALYLRLSWTLFRIAEERAAAELRDLARSPVGRAA